MHQCYRPHHIRVVRVTLCPVQERPETINFYQSKTTQHRLEAYGEVEEIEWEQTQTVDIEHGGVHVMDAQLGAVRLENAVLEVASPEVEGDVKDVDEVGEVVEGEPHRHVVLVDLLERESVDEDPEVVDEGDADHERPPVGEPAGRVEDECPFAAVLAAAVRGGFELFPSCFFAELFLQFLFALFSYALRRDGVRDVCFVYIAHLLTRAVRSTPRSLFHRVDFLCDQFH